NPLVSHDVSDVLRGSSFGALAHAIERGSHVRAVVAPKAAAQPRSFFDKLNEWGRAQEMPGVGYVTLAEGGAKGPIAKFLDPERVARLAEITGAAPGDAVLFVCAKRPTVDTVAGRLRVKVGEDVGLVQ